MANDESGSATRDLLQYLIFAALVVIGVSPLLLMLMKNVTYRERLRAVFACRDCSVPRRVRYDEADLRTLRELEDPPQGDRMGINGAYRMYQARRSRMSLRLASWREDVKRCGGEDDRLHHKLAQLRDAHHECQRRSAAAAAQSRESVIGITSTLAVPFDVHVVQIHDRVDESSYGSIPAALFHGSDVSKESDEESVYVMIPATPRNESRVHAGRYSVGSAGEEEEEKEDVAV
ncbi:unnamed protein product [Hyaloperonospora brassicae]|uniref:RxLR effector candidate protein n=1 Tax=Hyaloperonospora brassicae TaxID=162125 RepID=A0AAV0TU59_HYABA|nr:unnamed protein product [Hyaloperonospora brassicae]